MTPELKQALAVIKQHCETPKGKSFYERMDSASLKQRIETLKSEFTHYVDHQTIHYYYTQIKKQNPDWDGDYNVVELTKKQKEDCIQMLEWFKNDIAVCIAHLKK